MGHGLSHWRLNGIKHIRKLEENSDYLGFILRRNSDIMSKCHSKKTKKLLSEIAKMRWSDFAIRMKYINAFEKRILPDNSGSKNPMYGRCGKLHPRWGKKHTKKTKQLISKITKERLKNPENHPWYGRHHTYKTKKKMSMYAQNRSEKHRKKISKAAKKRYQDPRNNPFYGKHHTEETKKIQSKMRKKQMIENPKYLKSIIRHSNIKPNKFELAVQKWLDKKYPNEWKYCGDGSVILNGHCPDFINVNGKKQVILAHGNYWHTKRIGLTKQQAEQIDRKPYDELGYEVIFIWDDKFKKG